MKTLRIAWLAQGWTASAGRLVRAAPFPLTPAAIARHFHPHRDLIRRLVRREVLGRYEGSYFGILWSVLTPLLLLALYSFVFSVVFKARWGASVEEGLAGYAVTLYAGLITFLMFGEVISGAPQIVVSNPNYVTKVIFPLEILPLVRTLAVVTRAVPSFGILALVLLVRGDLSWTFLLLPLVLLPLVLLALAGAYLLAFLGVFVRDLAHAMTIVMRLLIYLSPVFYPVANLPDRLEPLALWSPLARVLEDCRRITVFGEHPDWWGLLGAGIGAGCLAWLGYVVFMTFKKAFADVV